MRSLRSLTDGCEASNNDDARTLTHESTRTLRGRTRVRVLRPETSPREETARINLKLENRLTTSRHEPCFDDKLVFKVSNEDRASVGTRSKDLREESSHCFKIELVGNPMWLR